MTNTKYRVIFLGPTGGGKTSVIKTLLRVSANSTPTTNEPESTTATTTTHQTYTATILGKEMVLTDTPGLRDPAGEAGIESELHGAFHDILPGPHIVVIVFSVRTSADVIRKTFLRCQDRLGQDVTRHIAVVFTCVDSLESSGSNFKGHVDSLPRHIKQLIGPQPVALNNNANAPLINVLQVKELMTKFDQILTKNFGMHFNVRRLVGFGRGDIATDVTDVFEKNSQVLDKKLSDKRVTEQDSSNTGVTVVTIEQTPGIQNAVSDAHDDNHGNGTSLTQQNGQETNALQPHPENVRLQSLPRSEHGETASRVSDDASLITSSSSNQDKDSQTCCCFANITRRFRSSQNEPEFKQFK
ncbi:GTPase IMAP family member 9-like [Amphiura filiformis]|uniref:GTPase IMAP family member 9-like n=1 Tax=Amphiura filiformis TaxID=82378 RepID=UPI003B21FEE4